MGLLFWGSDLTLYLMAIHRSLGKITSPLSHLPTWFFIIGYPLFWLQLYTHTASDGVTSALPWVLFGGVIVIFSKLSGPVLGFPQRARKSLRSLGMPLPRPPDDKLINNSLGRWHLTLPARINSRCLI